MLPIGLLQSACPWRTFPFYKGQKHYSGTYRSSAMRDHVIYESRLALTRLLLADFDRFIAALSHPTLREAAQALGFTGRCR